MRRGGGKNGNTTLLLLRGSIYLKQLSRFFKRTVFSNFLALPCTYGVERKVKLVTKSSWVGHSLNLEGKQVWFCHLSQDNQSVQINFSQA